MIGKWLRTALRLDDPKGWATVVGTSTITGEPLTRRGVLQLSAAWACMRLKSKIVGTLPMAPYRIVNDAPEIARDHWLYPIVRQKPNPEFTAARYWQSSINALDLDGNAYLEKLRGSGSRIAGLGWLNPALMDCNRNYNTGEIEYRYLDPITRKTRMIRPDNLVHVRQFSGGDIKGMSAVAYGARSLGLARDTITAAGSVYANGTRPGGFFKSPRVLEQNQRDDFKKNFITDREGPENSGWIGLLEGGFDWVEVNMKPEDAQLLESRVFDIEEICRWFDVPPIMIGHAPQGQTMWGTGVEQIQIQFQIATVAPMCIDIEQQLENDLLTPEDRANGVFLRFNIDAMMRSTAADRAAFLGAMVDKGIMARNEARRKENLPRAPGGDVLTVQQQMVPLEGIKERADRQSMLPAAPQPPQQPGAPQQ